MKKLLQELQQLEQYTKLYAVKNKQVSLAPVGWQLHHACLVVKSVVAAVNNSNPQEFKSKRSLKKFFVLGFNRIPRGSIQAPRPVQPATELEPAELHAEIQNAIDAVKSLQLLPQNAFFNHRIFGHINVTTTYRFLYVHTHHHVKIIRDILKG